MRFFVYVKPEGKRARHTGKAFPTLTEAAHAAKWEKDVVYILECTETGKEIKKYYL